MLCNLSAAAPESSDMSSAARFTKPWSLDTCPTCSRSCKVCLGLLFPRPYQSAGSLLQQRGRAAGSVVVCRLLAVRSLMLFPPMQVWARMPQNSPTVPMLVVVWVASSRVGQACDSDKRQ